MQAQVNEYKYEIERLTRDLEAIKKKYYETKKREQAEREKSKSLDGTDAAVKQALLRSLQQPRFTGGGFSISGT
jgi:hypothetical protein